MSSRDKIHNAQSACESVCSFGAGSVTLYGVLQVVEILLDVGLFVGFLAWRVAETVVPALLRSLGSTVARTTGATFHLLCK